MGNCCGVSPTLHEDQVFNSGSQTLEASLPTNNDSPHPAETSGNVSSSHVGNHMTSESPAEPVEAEPKVLEHIADREGTYQLEVVSCFRQPQSFMTKI